MKLYQIILLICTTVALLATGAWLIRRLFIHLSDQRIAAYQNDLLQKHYHEVETIYREMRGWRHDYHNHIQAMQAYSALGKYEELCQYLVTLDDDLNQVDTVIKTGNIMIDAILNSKISFAKAHQIAINAKAIVPKDLKITDIDLCVLLGNLMDNAIEACQRQEDSGKRFLRIYMGTLKGQLYLSVQNSVGGAIKKQNGGYRTSKQGYHGFGLKRVDTIIQKYNGFLNRQDEGDVFATEVMLPVL